MLLEGLREYSKFFTKQFTLNQILTLNILSFIILPHDVALVQFRSLHNSELPFRVFYSLSIMVVEQGKCGVGVKKKRVSKKNKKSWRKHTDTKDVDSFLDDKRLEERLGCVL
jgi:hypothetical protein